METETLSGVADACARLSIGHSQLYKLIDAGQLDARKIGTKTVITGSSIQKFIDSLPRMKRAA
jgi:excisionase family DNA binding protein